MTEYRVVWAIDIQAESHEDAARKALEIHRDPDSTATVFDVTESSVGGAIGEDSRQIDLLQLDEEAEGLEEEVEMERKIAKREGKRRKHYPEN